MFCDEIQEADRKAYGFKNAGSHPKLYASSIDMYDDSFNFKFKLSGPGHGKIALDNAKEALKKCRATIEKELEIKDVFKKLRLDI